MAMPKMTNRDATELLYTHADMFGKNLPIRGIRSELISSYEIPRMFYKNVRHSAARELGQLGCLVWYGMKCGIMGRTKRTKMDVDALVSRWSTVITMLATAHDKDTADRYEAAIEECLAPILTAPIAQVREFYPKLLQSLKENPSVPFLVWRSFEIWVDQILSKAPDEAVKQLKTELAKEISDLVEQEVKDQIPEALIRALQWRSPDTLQEVKDAVVEEKAAGRKPRLRGRESCLFLEVGGTEDEPRVCVQI